MKKHLKTTRKITEIITDIEYDGEKYPVNEHNRRVIKEYNNTGNEEVLSKLTKISLDFN